MLPRPSLAQPADENNRIIRVYDVSDLIDPQPDLLGDWLSGQGKGTVTGLSGFGGGTNTQMGGGGGGFGGDGGGGGGFGGGGGGGGGGFFSIPSDIQPQFGDFGSAAMSAGRLSSLMQLLISLDENGSQFATFGNLVVVSTSTKGHGQVEQLFMSLREKTHALPTLEIVMRLVPVDPTVGLDTTKLQASEIDALAATKGAISATVRCGNRRIGTISSGARRSFVISAVPVVGANGSNAASERSVGYSPRVVTPMIGLVGKVRPVLAATPSAQPRTATIDLGIVYSVGSDEVLSATFGSGQTIDRIDVDAVEFEGQMQVTENQWTLAGVTSVTAGDGSQNGLMAILIQWREAK